MSTPELWRPVPGYEGLYDVSDQGCVRSLSRKVNAGSGYRMTRDRILAASPDSSGYLIVALQRDGTRRNGWIHQLVCAAFHGPRPDGTEVRHLDGDRLNNTPGNLAYGTQAENRSDMVRHGTAQESKTHCPRGHELTCQNLVPDKASKGKRSCLACNRAQVFIYNQRRVADIDLSEHLKVIADAFYRSPDAPRGAVSCDLRAALLTGAAACSGRSSLTA